MIDIISYQRITNQKHKEISLYTCEDVILKITDNNCWHWSHDLGHREK